MGRKFEFSTSWKHSSGLSGAKGQVAALLLVFWGTALVGGCSDQGQAARADPRGFENGELADLDAGPDALGRMPMDQEAQCELTNVSNVENTDAVRQMMELGRVVVCTRGTKVAVIDRGILTTSLRIIEGKHNGRPGVVPSAFVKKAG